MDYSLHSSIYLKQFKRRKYFKMWMICQVAHKKSCAYKIFHLRGVKLKLKKKYKIIIRLF